VRWIEHLLLNQHMGANVKKPQLALTQESCKTPFLEMMERKSEISGSAKVFLWSIGIGRSCPTN